MRSELDGDVIRTAKATNPQEAASYYQFESDINLDATLPITYRWQRGNRKRQPRQHPQHNGWRYFLSRRQRQLFAVFAPRAIGTRHHCRRLCVGYQLCIPAATRLLYQ